MTLRPETEAVENIEGWGTKPTWGVYATLFLASCALLTLEISLTRFFSFTIWYHFAYLTISVALLGFGSSGAIIAAFPGIFRRYGQAVLLVTLGLSAVLTIVGFCVLSQRPVEVLDLTRRPGHFAFQMLYYYIIVGTPFLLAGFSISLPFSAYPMLMGRLYFWDLFGAAIGCVTVGLLVEFLGIPGLVFSAAGLLLAAAASLALSGGARRTGFGFAFASVFVLLIARPLGAWLPINITSSKNLTSNREEYMMHAKPGDRADQYYKWTALSRVDMLGWDHPSRITFHRGTGINNSWNGLGPLAARLMYDGGNGSDIYKFDGNIDQEFAMLEHHILRTPYLSLNKPNVLVIGVGGGIDLFNAIKQGARHVTGVELQGETVKLLKGPMAKFTGGFYERPDVSLIHSEGRHFVRKTDEIFDLVQITAVDTFAAQATGAYVMAESYLYTVEAMEDYFRRLTPDGMVSMVIGDLQHENSLPPLGGRLCLIGYRALQRQGVADPSKNILVIGTVQTGSVSLDQSILIKKTPFTPQEIQKAKDFAAENNFMVVYAPDGGDYMFSTLLGPDEQKRQDLMSKELFRMEATYDNDPFLYNVSRWSNFSPEKSMFFNMPGSFMGQLVLVMMVSQAVLLGIVLIVVPLLFGARQGLKAPRVLSYMIYFLSLGVGFMFIEISFVQSFVLFLGSPTYALSVTIFSLLLFSSIGSFLSSRFSQRPDEALRRIVVIVAGLVVLYDFGLARVFDAALHLDLIPRIAIAVLAQMPLGLTLGMFMPLGVAHVARENPRLVPWAWGINGVGSVIGTTTAVILAMSYGFTVVALCAAGLYLFGTTILLREGKSASR